MKNSLKRSIIDMPENAKKGQERNIKQVQHIENRYKHSLC